jgi:autotransporter-associated beta strand protein
LAALPEIAADLGAPGAARDLLGEQYQVRVEELAGSMDDTGLTGTSSDAIVDDGALIARDTTRTLTLSNIHGTGTLTQSGTATTTLTGTTSYTGATTITSGTLELGAGADGIAASSSLTLTGGTLDIATAATDQAVNNLTGTAGDIALGAHTLTVRSTASTTYRGTFTGTGGLTKTGTGRPIHKGSSVSGTAL